MLLSYDRCGDFNWVAGRAPDPAQPLQVKVRHGPVLYDCSVSFEDTRGASANCSSNKSGMSGCGGSDSISSELAGPSAASLHDCAQLANIVSWQSTYGDGALGPVDGSESSSREESGCLDSSHAESASFRPVEPLYEHAADAGRRTQPESDTYTTAVVKLTCQDQGLAPGQFAVFYQHGICVGSGVIIEAL